MLLNGEVVFTICFFGVLNRRFIEGKPFTNSGGLLLSVNPNRIVTDDEGISIFDPVYMYRYRHRPPKYMLDSLPASKREVYQLPPHVFQLTQEALIYAMTDQLSQYMVFLGESGSGKTEASKHAITYVLQYCAEARLKQEKRSERRASFSGNSYRGLVYLRSADIFDAKRDTINRQGRYGLPQNSFYQHGLNDMERLPQAAEVVLDAFGTAGCISNLHSSRSARLTKLYFTRDGLFMGAKYSAVLLDTQRVSNLSDEINGELAAKRLNEGDSRSPLISNLVTNYHIFYYMLAGLEPRTKRELDLDVDHPSAYRYLRCVNDLSGNESKPAALNPHADHARCYRQVCEAFSSLGLNNDVQLEIWKVLAGILHLGNLEISPGDRSRNMEVQISSNALRRASKALMIDVDTLQGAVSGKLMDDEEKLIFDVATAQAKVDDLCCSLYETLFDWIIERINLATDPVHDPRTRDMWNSERENIPFGQVEPLHIGLVDCPGFDVRPGSRLHGLPTLMINHTDERLQSAFIEAFFVHERQILEDEQVDSSHIRYEDNLDILQAVDNPRTGVLSMCEEAAQYKRNNTSTLASKLHTLLKRNQAYTKEETSKDEPPVFTLHHTPANVSYSLSQLVQGNSENVNPETCQLLKSASQNLLFTSLLDTLGSSIGQLAQISSRSSPTLLRHPPSARIGRRLDDIFSVLSSGSPWCVRCLKPNSDMRSDFVHIGYLLHELRYSAVLNTASLRHSGYSYRTTFDDFYSRFIIIAQQGKNLVFPPPPYINMRALCNELLNQLLQHPAFDNIDLSHGVQLGSSKVFLRKQIIDTLESLREVRLQAMDRVTVKFQALYRGYQVRKSLHFIEEGMSLFQAAWVAHMHRSMWNIRLKSVKLIQGIVRTWLDRKMFVQIRNACVRIQRWYRNTTNHQKFKNVRKGIRSLHTLARGYIVRQHVLAMLECVIKLQRACRGFLFRCRLRHLQNYAAKKIQAVWRGFWSRILHEDELYQLQQAREQRLIERRVSVIKATWKMALTQRRFQELKQSAIKIQKFIRSKYGKLETRKKIYCVRIIQACVRGFIARRCARHLRAWGQLADNLWSLHIWRQAELCDCLQSNGTEAVLGTCPINHSQHQTLTSLIDVDSTVHMKDAFPRGLSRGFDELLTALTDHGQRLVSVAVCSSCCIAVVDNGHVYSWGLNDRGQCGLGHTQPVKRATRIDAFVSGDAFGFSPNTMTLMPFSNSPRTSGRDATLATASPQASFEAGLRRNIPSIRITSVACGEGHTVALTSSGIVFTWGDSRFGQLGCGSFDPLYHPTPVEVSGQKVCAVAAGDHHSLALLTNGSVLAWGRGKFTGLALPETEADIEDFFTPRVIEALNSVRIRSICASGGLSAAVSTTGLVYTWGNNRKGQCGQGHTSHVHLPVVVDSLRDGTFNSSHPSMRYNPLQHSRIVQLSCSRNHCLAVSSTRRVFSWGDNSYGQLGHGDLRNRLTPTHIHNLEHVGICEAVASNRSSFVLTNLHEILVFGSSNSIQSSVAHSELMESSDFVCCSDSVDSTSLNKPELVSEVRSLYPVEIPVGEIPGRVPQHLFHASSSTFSVCLVQYDQASLSKVEIHQLLQQLTLRPVPSPFNLTNEIETKKVAESAMNSIEKKTYQTFAASLMQPDAVTNGQRARVDRNENQSCSLAEQNINESLYSPLEYLKTLVNYCEEVRKFSYGKSSQKAYEFLNRADGVTTVAALGVIRNNGGVPQIASYLDGTHGAPLTCEYIDRHLHRWNPPSRVIDAFVGLNPRSIAGITQSQFDTIMRRLMNHSAQHVGFFRYPSISYKKEKKYKNRIACLIGERSPRKTTNAKGTTSSPPLEYLSRGTWNTDVSSARSAKSPEERAKYLRQLRQISPADMVGRTVSYMRRNQAEAPAGVEHEDEPSKKEHTGSVYQQHSPLVASPQSTGEYTGQQEGWYTSAPVPGVGSWYDDPGYNTIVPTSLSAELVSTLFESHELINANQTKYRPYSNSPSKRSPEKQSPGNDSTRSSPVADNFTVRGLLQKQTTSEQQSDEVMLENELNELKKKLKSGNSEEGETNSRQELVESVRRDAELAAEKAWRRQHF